MFRKIKNLEGSKNQHKIRLSKFFQPPIQTSILESTNDLPFRRSKLVMTFALNYSTAQSKISPGPESAAWTNRALYQTESRDWVDRDGNVVATGTMIDLRRGYVIIKSALGTARVPYAKLSDADWATISQFWQIPELCSAGNQGTESRNWAPQTYAWQASALCHKPLYFENVQLERYGHTHGPLRQPIHSVAHFFVSLVTVPYQTGIHPVNECQYALGFYRPGDCAPWLKDPIPFSLNGAVRQALVTTGVAVIP